MDGEQKTSTPQAQPGQTIAPGSETVPPVPITPVAPVIPAGIMPSSVAVPPLGSDGSITWTASEFVAHQKSPMWYLALAGMSAVIAIVVYLLIHDITSVVVIIVAAIIFGIYGARKPRQVDYVLDEQGLSVGQRYFGFDQFRSFSIVDEGAFASIVFVPLQRFAPLTTIYYDPADEEKIIDLLADRLPHEERKRDMFERFLWRVRF